MYTKKYHRACSLTLLTHHFHENRDGVGDRDSSSMRSRAVTTDMNNNAICFFFSLFFTFLKYTWHYSSSKTEETKSRVVSIQHDHWLENPKSRRGGKRKKERKDERRWRKWVTQFRTLAKKSTSEAHKVKEVYSYPESKWLTQHFSNPTVCVGIRWGRLGFFQPAGPLLCSNHTSRTTFKKPFEVDST